MTVRAKIQVELERKGALPEDVSVNTWHFEADEASPSAVPDRDKWDLDIGGLIERVETFYVALSGIFARTLTGNGLIKAYDMGDPAPQLPRVVYPFIFVTSASALPAELAVCLSFQGATESGANMRRRRGRVFLGPLGQGAMIDTSPNADVRVNQSAIDTILAAAGAMVLGGPGTFRLAVFSPTTNNASPGSEAAWNDVTRFWVDNAWDVMRSRGADATARTILEVTG